MRRGTPTITAAALAVLALWAPAAAQGAFGLKEADVRFETAEGALASQAGAHPYAFTTSLAFNTRDGSPITFELPDGSPKDITIAAVPGLVGNPTATPRCATLQFLQKACPADSRLGYTDVTYSQPGNTGRFPVYNLVPPPGVAAKFGFTVVTVPVTVEAGVNPDPPYNVIARVPNASQALPFYGASTTLWGNPPGATTPFLTLPRACRGPLPTYFAVDSWEDPGAFVEPPPVFTHDESEPPAPRGFGECSKLDLDAEITAQPTSRAASSPSGLDFGLDVGNGGLNDADGVANSDIEKAEVTLPEGMSVNPSQAEGLEVCSEDDLQRETAFSAAGEGCPNASKIGAVEVETPLLEDQVLKGSLYVAEPYENPFDALIAFYIVIKDPGLGISVTQAARVESDPVSGRLVTVTEDMPQLPFSHFRLHFREGARSPLVTPPACGSYQVKAKLYPYSGNTPVTSTSAFQIVSGSNDGPCPSGGLPPFKPGLIAGTLNNRAGSFSPFNLRLFRSDSEQEITHFSIKLPPGITGKLAGIPYCSNAAIEAAKARTGPHGGQEELEHPSCPAASQIGRTLAGAGVGPSPAYAPGKVYLAGPYHGSNLSMVAITSGVVGPFDIGTVVVREGFKINPETAEVFIDSTGSDPIPHIIQGIPVHLRDIRAYVDKPEFVLNPTDCTATSTASTVLGSGLDFVSEADDNPITVSSPFQAADCAALPFKPQLSMKLTGGTHRGAHPKFSAHLAMNGIGESGIQSAQVTLPKSEFIENAHFKTICTRVQFKEGAGNGANCPAGSVYGHAKAVTPILAEPLEGPVFLRSSEHPLPDLVVALHNSQVDFDLVGRVDSVKSGGLRNTFETAPDAPVTSFDIELEGASKGLFVNSANLCAKKHFAKADFTGQNGKEYDTKPELKVKCKGKKRHKSHKGHKRMAPPALRAAWR